MSRKTIDTKYVKLLQQGDGEAFEEIFRFYKDSIYYFSLSFVKNQADAEEVVQETFIQALKHIDTLEKPSSFHSWIHKIAYNKSMTLYKKNSKNVQVSNDFNLENIIEGKEGPENMLSRSEIISVIQSEIENMPEALVQVAQLRYFDDFTTREISEIMDIPEGTVKTRLKRVRKIIQPRLSARGFTPAKYFTFLLTPMIFEAFQQAITVNSMSLEASNRLLANMSDTTTGLLASIAAGAATSGALGGAGATVGNGVQTAAKITIAAVSGGAGVYGVYQVAQPVPAYIEHIAYYDEITNSNIEVEIALTKDSTVDQVHLYLEGEELNFNLNNNTLIFEADTNGDYTIKVGDESHTFTISNIDKMAPELTVVEKNGSQLNIQSNDDLAGIDFEKSYLLDKNNNKIPIPENGIIDGEYDGIVQIQLVDKVGNSAVYDVNLEV